MSEIKKDNWQKIEDKLSTIKYHSDGKSHLIPTPSDCDKCKDKPCTYFCPANVYSWDKEQNKLIVCYENCVECGSCRIACTYKSIDWRYPKSGCGVTFKHG